MKVSEAARSLLHEWLFPRLEAAGRDWLKGQLAALPGSRDDRPLHLAFGMVPRRLGKAPLRLAQAELETAERCLPGWSPRDWSVADAGRILLLASLPAGDPDFAPRFRGLCQTADVAESVSLYRGLPLYPDPAALEPIAGEGLRSNMQSVFAAIALHNPYPRQYFAAHRWNHMVLKAVFINCRLAAIQGLDARANAELAAVLLDFVHERRAAGRPVPHEIWRCIGPFARGDALRDLRQAVQSGTPVERQAAALALAASPDPGAAQMLQGLPDLAADIASGRLSWAVLQ